MACGCALVSTDCGGASDIIEHHRTGLIVPVADPDAMVQSILRLLDDAALRKRFAAASSGTLDNFTWLRAIDAFEHALAAIADGSASPTPRPEHHATSL
jgi:glycosyltransferase involved in cell wall biosynthesis